MVAPLLVALVVVVRVLLDSTKAPMPMALVLVVVLDIQQQLVPPLEKLLNLIATPVLRDITVHHQVVPVVARLVRLELTKTRMLIPLQTTQVNAQLVLQDIQQVVLEGLLHLLARSVMLDMVAPL